MNRHPLIALLFVAACAPTLEPDPTPDGEGTEIGDEGSGWLCSEDSQPVADATAEIDAFGASPAELLDGRTGDFSGTGVTVSIVADTDAMTFFDYEPGDYIPPDEEIPECPDALYVGAEIDLAIDGLTLSTPIAGLSFGEEGGASFSASVVVHEDWGDPDPDDDEPGSDDDDGGGYWDQGEADYTVSPTTFDMDDTTQTQIVVIGVWNGAGWDIEAAWWADSKPQGDNANVESYQETFWTGSAAAD